MRTSIIIPAYNEEQSIGLVIQEIPKEHVSEIIVISNGSTDKTLEVAQAHGARTYEEHRRGYGYACLKGIAHIAPETEIIVILDGDHSDYPEELPSLLGPIMRNEADFVIGSRTQGTVEQGALLWNQRVGNALACLIIHFLYGRRFTDLGPFRALRRECLEALQMKDKTWGWNIEMQVKAIIKGFRIVEVPCRYRKRIGKSKISGTVIGTLRAGWKIILTAFRYYPRFLYMKYQK
jgi:glycosyltransferase involved in cell wall biosynthesis